MIRVKFEDFMHAKYRSGAWSLYVVKDEKERVLYVGISDTGVSDRWFRGSSCHLQANIYGQFYGTSPVGELIAEKMPASLEWTIELWTTTQLINLFRRRAPLKELEYMMIEKLNPSLNVVRPKSLFR